MRDIPSASHDATSSDDQCCDSTDIPRRSMSIFSRKGVETPEPISSVPLVAVETLKQMSDKQRSWLSRRWSSRDDFTLSNHGRFTSPRGTVLHAVPPASVIRLSSLEEEMAQGPNEEILSAISKHAPSLPACRTLDSLPAEQQEHPNRYSSFKGTGRGSSNSHIGVWIDGVVHWNERQACGTTSSMTDSTLPCSTVPEVKQQPCLSMPLPDGETMSNGCTIYQPQPYRPLPLMMSAQCAATPFDRPTAPLRKHSPSSRVSHSSTSSRSLREEGSICSKRSSATSIEAPGNAVRKHSSSPIDKLHAMHQYVKAEKTCNANGNPEAASRHWFPPMPPQAATCPPADHRTAQTTDFPAYSDEILPPCDVESSSPYVQSADASPTWSQAEHDLQRELSVSLQESAQPAPDVAVMSPDESSIRRSGSVHEVMQPPSRAPTIPKRSRKREWRTHFAYPASELQRRQSEMQQRVSAFQDINIPRKSASISRNASSIPEHIAPRPPERSKRRPVSNAYARCTDMAELDVETVATRRRDAISAAMTPTVAAEEVLLHILARLHSPKDLFNTAIINKGMYRVYKENEMHLLRIAVYNESPASWELREWSPPDRDEVRPGDSYSSREHSPLSYICGYRNDMAVIERLKRLILERCQSFLRRETVFALSTPTHPNASRFNDAFWRIWSFCQIFGCVKNREDDFTGQMDWLRGGVLANNEDCIASTDPNMEFDVRSVLISPPACFAEGNKGGLGAGQLVDMTEIWTCLTVLLQDYHGQAGQARYYGVFDQCELIQDDIEHEELLLEEWTAYLMTLGPRIVLAMAEVSPAAGFALAKDNGWTRWAPPIYNGSRTSFLKEPVAKSYEEQIILAKQRLQDPDEQVRKDASRRRVATLAAEIRLRRQSSAFKRSPLIDMSTERAMSTSSRRDSIISTRLSYPRATSRRASVLSPRACHSIREDDVENPGRRSDGLPKDTGEVAIQQLVAMGFERDMVIDALRITDRGDGLRPDRAVELLLSQQE